MKSLAYCELKVSKSRKQFLVFSILPKNEQKKKKFNLTEQLNEYESAPYFLQLGQNMTSDCFFNFLFFLVLT